MGEDPVAIQSSDINLSGRRSNTLRRTVTFLRRREETMRRGLSFSLIIHRLEPRASSLRHAASDRTVDGGYTVQHVIVVYPGW